MSVFRVISENCKSCYKCLRDCPVKAIYFEDGGVQISEARCVQCGACHDGCTHGAIRTLDDIERTKSLLAGGRRVVMSMDPACFGSFPVTSLEQMVAAIKKLGFWGVADTSSAAAAVAQEYNRIACEGKQRNIITSSCPAVCAMVEKYYPDLLDCLAPVVSPMIAHGRILKHKYGNIAVVYVGPCVARFDEARDVRHSTEINAVLSYSELSQWLEDEGIDIASMKPEPLLEPGSSTGRLYPMEGGMLRCIESFGTDMLYRRLSVDGRSDCLQMLDAMRSGEVSGCLVEMNACSSACINGSARVKGGLSMFGTRIRIEEYVDAHRQQERIPENTVSLAWPPIAKPIVEYEPDEEQIRHVLYSMGMDDPEWELNCGACGYSSCREKATAVLQKRSELSMCLTALRKRAESISNYVLDEIPMITIIVDQKQKIIEFNREACSAFKITRAEAVKMYIFELIDPADFQYVLDTGLPIKNKRMELPEQGLKVVASLVPIKAQGVAMGIYEDVTAEGALEEKRLEQRLRSVEMAQKVIDKQMMVAQEIASLLGETTAETKSTLNSLKRQILDSGDDI